jgi:hypothetical protein
MQAHYPEVADGASIEHVAAGDGMNRKVVQDRDKGRSNDQGKKPYEAPHLATISLRPEEAVLGHCKVLGTGGAGGSACGFTCPSAGS